MPKIKQKLSSKRDSTVKKGHTFKTSKKNTYTEIYPMMPRGYTAVQRAALRKFEQELYGGEKVTVE